MKTNKIERLTILITLFLISTITISWNLESKNTIGLNANKLHDLQPSFVKEDINFEKLIDSALNLSISNKNPKYLMDVFKIIEAKTTDTNQVYWLGYTFYNQAIYYLVINDKNNSQINIEKGIKLLDKIKKKNSEDFALIALMKSFSTQFEQGINAGLVSAKASRMAKKSLLLNPNNLRAYFVLGQIDFYTPEEFGGKKNTENYLKKAILLIKMDKKTAIQWGGSQSFELLAKYYKFKKMTNEFNEVIVDGLKYYPNNYVLKELKNNK